MGIFKQKSKILIDTNIFLDVFQERENFVEASTKILNLVYENKIDGIIAAHSIPNLWYILRKTHTEEQRRNILRAICTLFTVSNLDSTKIFLALERNNFHDFEDCLQDECAQEESCDYIITRNTQDFSKARIPALLPEDFLQCTSDCSTAAGEDRS